MANVINTATTFVNSGSSWSIRTDLTFDSRILNWSSGGGEVNYDFGIIVNDGQGRNLINNVYVNPFGFTKTFLGNVATFTHPITSPLSTPGANYVVLIDGGTVNTVNGYSNSLVQIRTDLPFYSGTAAYFLNTFVSSAVAQSLNVAYVLNDTASVLSQNLNVLNQFSSRISTVTVSDNAPITVAPNQINANLPILTKINSGGGSYVIQQPVTYSFSSTNNLVHEGASINLFLNTTGLNNGSTISYSISGIAADRLNSGSLFGTATVDSNGQARINLDIRANNRTDGPSTATVTIGNNLASTSVTINDTSLGAPSYTLTPSSSIMNEGVANNITLQTANLTVGSTVTYAISGIAANRLSTGSLSGTVAVDASGQAVIPFSVINNNLTDGPATAVITIGNNLASTSVSIIDTSLTPTTTQVSLVPKVAYVVSSPNLTISGTSVVDAASFIKTKASVTIKISGTQTSVVDNSGALGTTVLNNIERLQFTDTMLALDIGKDQTAGSGYMLYKAAFNRTPDVGGLGYWISKMDGGMSYSDVAKNFVTSTEFQTAFGGSNPSVNTLVTKLYNNVLNRTPDAGGLAFWQDKLNTGWSTADVLGYFSTSAENVTNVTPLIANGISYTQFVG